MRSMVQGAHLSTNESPAESGAPSTTPLRDVVPLPVPGRIELLAQRALHQRGGARVEVGGGAVR